ncbi:hypothetical protein M0R19_05695 [Candidatus Pacearchaeota archaeon]|nr:hypothetical protein [Candidatus Pacearchaeota archaeon]
MMKLFVELNNFKVKSKISSIVFSINDDFVYWKYTSEKYLFMIWFLWFGFYIWYKSDLQLSREKSICKDWKKKSGR